MNLMKNDIVYWKQRNGVLISIDDMDINHLRNTLKMIIRNNNKKQAFVLNGDMANEFNNNYPDDDCYDEDDYPIDVLNQF
jgi:hypothetical protein